MNTFIKVVYSCLLVIGWPCWGADPVRIAYPAAGTIVSAQIGLIFEKTDILKKHGFAATVVSLGTGRELKTALVSGRTDVILTSQSNFVILLGEGFAAKAVNSLGSAGRMAMVVAAKSPLKSLSDLKGKSVATIFGTSLHQPAVEWATEAGGAKVVNINQVGALHAALETGAVDAVLTYDPYLTELEAAGKVRVLKEDRFSLITVAAEKFVSRNPAKIAALNHAFADAVAYMRTHRDQVNGWFSERAKLSVESIHRASSRNENYAMTDNRPAQLALSDEFLKKLQSEGEFLFREKIIKKAPDIRSQVMAIK